jgi:hypothetical protein
MRNPQVEISRDVQFARSLWGPLSRSALIRLKQLIDRFGLSVARGELQYLYEGWYVTEDVRVLVDRSDSRCSAL